MKCREKIEIKGSSRVNLNGKQSQGKSLIEMQRNIRDEHFKREKRTRESLRSA